GVVDRRPAADVLDRHDHAARRARVGLAVGDLLLERERLRARSLGLAHAVDAEERALDDLRDARAELRLGYGAHAHSAREKLAAPGGRRVHVTGGYRVRRFPARDLSART